MFSQQQEKSLIGYNLGLDGNHSGTISRRSRSFSIEHSMQCLTIDQEIKKKWSSCYHLFEWVVCAFEMKIKQLK